MTRVRITYVALDSDGNKPILSASTFKDLKNGLDDYYGVGGKDETAKCLGWFPYNTKFPDEYEGYFEYVYTKQYEMKDKVKVYSVNYYPHTEYEVEVDENNYPLIEGTINLCKEIINKCK
jgi:hypothetical protein